MCINACQRLVCDPIRIAATAVYLAATRTLNVHTLCVRGTSCSIPLVLRFVTRVLDGTPCLIPTLRVNFIQYGGGDILGGFGHDARHLLPLGWSLRRRRRHHHWCLRNAAAILSDFGLSRA